MVLCDTENEDIGEFEMKIVLSFMLIAFIPFSMMAKTAYILVALCDNESQGIVPVSRALGDGDNPKTNLYWGSRYGYRTWFDREPDWRRLHLDKGSREEVLERIVFVNGADTLIIEGWRGREIKKCTETFLRAAAGEYSDQVVIDGKSISYGSDSDLIAYAGHDGLMDFSLSMSCEVDRSRSRDVVILACYSRRFFKNLIRKIGANPLVWTTHLMCPEAYTMEALIEKRFDGGTEQETREAAAGAYAKYQKCRLSAAMNLLVTGY